jgi:putative ABC transport system permease protein
VIGTLIVLVGMGLLVLGLFSSGGNLLAVGIGMGVVFLGVAILGPMLAGPISAGLGAPIRRVRGIPGALARENAMRNPKRTSATAAALMIGVGLVGLITIFGASARKSIDAALDRSMKADYVVRNTGGFGIGNIPVSAEQSLAAVPNVKSVMGVRVGQAEIKGSVRDLNAADPKLIQSTFDLQPIHGSFADLGPTGLAVLEHQANTNNLHIGSKVPVKFAETGTQIFTVQVIYKQAGFADWVTSLAAYENNFADQFDQQIYIKTTNGVTPENTAALKTVLARYPGPSLQTREQFKQSQASQINQFLNLVYVLLFFAIVIALFGIANTLGLSIIERTHELGLLRAVGMSRKQLRQTVRWESVIIALLGTLLGLVIGVAFAWAMVKALSDQGIDQFSLAPVQLVVIIVLAGIFGVVAAAFPARRAARLDILRSIHTE